MAQLGDRLHDLIHLIRQNQTRQMQHRAHPNARAKIRRARGEVAQLRVKREIQFLLQTGVKPIHLLPNLFHLQPRQQRLHPQVILFIDHHAQRLVLAKHQPAARALGRVLAADQMPLHEQLLVQRLQRLHRFRKPPAHRRGRRDRRLNKFARLHPTRLFRAPREWPTRHIARQTHAARQHHVILRPFAIG